MRFTSPNSPWIRLYCFILLGTCNCGVHHNYCFVWCQRDYHIVLCTFRFLRFRLDNYIGNLELWCICCCCLFPPWSISCFVLIYSCPYSLLIIKRKTKFQSKDLPNDNWKRHIYLQLIGRSCFSGDRQSLQTCSNGRMLYWIPQWLPPCFSEYLSPYLSFYKFDCILSIPQIAVFGLETLPHRSMLFPILHSFEIYIVIL